MFYEIVKVFNNNVVLLKNNNEQCVLISKGIGFGKKTGEKIDILAINEVKKIFYTNPEENTKISVKKLETSMKILEEITDKIIKDALKQLNISDKNLLNGIFDHIIFVVESLKAGVPIQNPFVSEIKILCSNEFEIVNEASKSIEEKLGVTLLDGEKALIALHLNSARKQQNLVSATIDIMVFSKIFVILGIETYTNDSSRGFILAVNLLINAQKENKYILNDDFNENIMKNLENEYKKAEEISKLLKNEKVIEKSSKTFEALLAIEIYKLM